MHHTGSAVIKALLQMTTFGVYFSSTTSRWRRSRPICCCCCVITFPSSWRRTLRFRARLSR